MAGTITWEFGGGALVVVVAYDNALRVERATATNRSSGAATINLTRTPDPVDPLTPRPAHLLVSPANSGSLFVTVDTSPLLRIQLTERSPGKLDGLDGMVDWEGGGIVAAGTINQGSRRERFDLTAANGKVKRE